MIRYRWRYLDPLRGITITTRHWAAEHGTKVAHPDAVPVEGTRQELVVPDDLSVNSTGKFCASKK